jgi:hypothetical protein
MDRKISRALRAAKCYADGGDVEDKRSAIRRAYDTGIDYAGRGLALADLYSGGMLSSVAGLNPFGSYSNVMEARERALAGVPREAKALATEPVTPLAAMAVAPAAGRKLDAAVERALRAAEKIDPSERFYATHNLSADNLRFADRKMDGQLPVPSLGVVKGNHPIEGFGEITLVADPGMVKPSAKTPVGAGDIYSPRFPDLNLKLPSKMRSAVEKELRPFDDRGDLESFMRDIERYRVSNVVDNPVLGRLYAQQRGIETPNTGDTWRDGRALMDRLRDDADYKKWTDEYIQALEGSGDLKMVKGWNDNTMRERLAPFTVDNIVKHMKARGGGAGEEGFDYGLGNVRARLAKRFSSLGEMQDNRNLLAPKSTWEPQSSAISDEISNKAIELAEAAAKYRPKDRREELSESMRRIEAMRSAIGRGKSELQWQYDLDKLPADFDPWMAEIRNRIRNLPTDYFEAKPQRAVPVTEFKGALIPDDASGHAIDLLRKYGIERLEPYSGDKRMEALMKFGDIGFASGGAV